MACVSEAPTHNAYMYSIYHRDMLNDAFAARINNYWQLYTDGKIHAYDGAALSAYARRHKDTALLTYLRHLGVYLDICSQMGDTWNYPTKRQLIQRRNQLAILNQSARQYRGATLRPQYSLLVMRTYFMMQNYQQCRIYWQNVASRQPASVFRDMMQDLYAGTLVRSGHYEEACNIYAGLGDMRSIKWCMRRNRNLAGIQQMYAANPNSASLPYLVQDFVNNAQETLDQKGADDAADMMAEIGASAVYEDEVMRFADFAVRAAADGKTAVPQMYQTAAAFVHYLFGKQSLAQREIDAAQSMRGTARMADNARAIRLLISVNTATRSAAYSAYLTRELKWLVQQSEQDGNTAYDFPDNHYTDVIQRIVYNNLIPKYQSWGDNNVSTALFGAMDAMYGYASDDTRNYGYMGDYFDRLDTMQIDRMVAYRAYVGSHPTDVFEQWVLGKLHVDGAYFDDLIGTKYMRLGMFDKAAEYFRRVPMSFLSRQNISRYMLSRDYTVERWMRHQKLDYADDGPVSETFKSNPKLQFALEMSGLERKYEYLANTGERQQLAYQLAVRYYQASYDGDCWYLTRYGQSIADSARVNEKDYVSAAIGLLVESRQSVNSKLQESSLYALAYIPQGPWGGSYDEYEKRYDLKSVDKTSRQYQALRSLAVFAEMHSVSDYVSRCDVLRIFRKTQRPAR